MITSQQGRMALRPLIGTSRSWRSSSTDKRLPLANKNSDEFLWTIKQFPVPVLPPYKTPAASWHLISPAAANHAVDMWEVLCLWCSNGILLQQSSMNEGPDSSRPKQHKNYARNQMLLEVTSVGGAAVLTDCTPVLFITYYTVEINILSANGAYKFRI